MAHTCLPACVNMHLFANRPQETPEPTTPAHTRHHPLQPTSARSSSRCSRCRFSSFFRASLRRCTLRLWKPVRYSLRMRAAGRGCSVAEQQWVRNSDGRRRVCSPSTAVQRSAAMPSPHNPAGTQPRSATRPRPPRAPPASRPPRALVLLRVEHDLQGRVPLLVLGHVVDGRPVAGQPDGRLLLAPRSLHGCRQRSVGPGWSRGAVVCRSGGLAHACIRSGRPPPALPATPAVRLKTELITGLGSETGLGGRENAGRRPLK